jgi:hypothetical protein
MLSFGAAQKFLRARDFYNRLMIYETWLCLANNRSAPDVGGRKFQGTQQRRIKLREIIILGKCLVIKWKFHDIYSYEFALTRFGDVSRKSILSDIAWSSVICKFTEKEARHTCSTHSTPVPHTFVNSRYVIIDWIEYKFGGIIAHYATW